MPLLAAFRPIGLEVSFVKLEVAEAAALWQRRQLLEESTPPDQYAYMAHMAPSDAVRTIHCCWWVCWRAGKKVGMYFMDRKDAFGRQRHDILASLDLPDVLAPDAANRVIQFFSKAQIHVITQMGLVRAYGQDFAATQGNGIAMYGFTKYVDPVSRKVDDLHLLAVLIKHYK